MDKQFRVTLWFKKGELDAYHAEQALGGNDELHSAAVDLLPVEDRYLDDGSITREDSAMFSIHTGSTQYVPKMDAPEPCDDDMGHLVSDLKRGRRKVVAAIGAAMAAACVMLAVYMF